jgi:hypothetical protein
LVAVSEFWQSELAARVKHPLPLRRLLEVAEKNPQVLFDLTFHARFANNLLAVMKREGKDVQGFERMQQSFRESVEKVRSILLDLGNSASAGAGFADSTRYTELSQAGMQALMDLISDLAVVKEWQVSQTAG